MGEIRASGGSTSPRWIQQLLTDTGFGGEASEVSGAANARGPGERHQHCLLLIGNQSSRTLNPPATLHCVCVWCDYHYILSSYAARKEGHCRLPTTLSFDKDVYPLHHLCLAYTASPEEIASRRTPEYPVVSQSKFKCSAKACTFEVSLEVSEPRMSTEERDILEDVDRVRRNILAAKRKDPERFADADDTWQRAAPSHLNTYIRNTLEGRHLSKPISQTNKKFCVVLGPECYPMLERLGFKNTVSSSDDGTEFPVFKPPAIPAASDGPADVMVTEPKSARAFLEDFRAEIENIIFRSQANTNMVPVYCFDHLEQMLGCHNYPRHRDHRNTIIYPSLDHRVIRFKEPAEFANLGASCVFPEELILYAFRRQCAVCRPQLLDTFITSLQKVASSNRYVNLPEYAALEFSLMDELKSQPRILTGPVRYAMETLRVKDPQNDDEDAIMNAFYGRITENPAQLKFMRSMLLTIAEDTDLGMKALVPRGNSMLPKIVALQLLNLGEQATADEIAERAKITVLENPAKEALRDAVREALAALSEYYRAPELVTLSGSLMGADIEANEQPTRLDVPVGLANIGNTCYLNSILQLLYSCKAVRDVILDHEPINLEATDENIDGRRIGGNRVPLERAESVVSQVFIKELKTLFEELNKSTAKAVKPSQLLANSALIASHQLINEQSSAATADGSQFSMPPPLPARPPTKDVHATESKMVTPPASPTADMAVFETASTESAQTLVDINNSSQGSTPHEPLITSSRQSQNVVTEAMDATKDVSMLDGDENKVLAEDNVNVMSITVLKERLEACLKRQTRSSGTDQQDFEEVHGRIINLIQASIVPSRIDPNSNIQWDRIMDTFYVTIANYTKTEAQPEPNLEEIPDRYITAYPAEHGPCTLLEALDRNFDRQRIEGSNTQRWSSIRQAPPILNVLIQRSRSGGAKNRNQVKIPEVLDLSRYMDRPPPGPGQPYSLLPARARAWNVNSQIEVLEKLKSDLGNSTTDARDFITALSTISEDPCFSTAVPDRTSIVERVGRDFEDDGWSTDAIARMVTPSTAKEISKSAARPQALQDEDTETDFQEISLEDINKQADGEILELKRFKEDILAETATQFNQDLVLYNLHAVIYHMGGGARVGHYWVCIKDHKHGVWRKYNDERVEEWDSLDQVLTTNADPYYLCYVRAHDSSAHVDIPIRPSINCREDTDKDITGCRDGDGDVVIVDAPKTRD